MVLKGVVVMMVTEVELEREEKYTSWWGGEEPSAEIESNEEVPRNPQLRGGQTRVVPERLLCILG